MKILFSLLILSLLYDNVLSINYQSIVTFLRHAIPRAHHAIPRSSSYSIVNAELRHGGAHGIRKTVQNIGSNIIGGATGGAAVEGVSQLLSNKRKT